MRIDLAGWSSRGLRSPDVDVDLTDGNDNPAKVALVQMPNGTGKTTTLELIKATLSNTASNWKPHEVRRYRRRRDERPEGQFKVRLMIDGRPLTLELTLDFENGSTRYRTTNIGSGGISAGWNPPPAVHRFLSQEFLRLFVFDGEFAEDLFNPEKAEADRAIDALCQLYLLKEASDFAEGEWETKSKLAGPKTDTGLKRYEVEQEKLTKREEELERLGKAAESEVQRLDKQTKDLQTKIDERLASMESTREEHAEAVQKLNNAKSDVFAAAASAMGVIRMPLAIGPEFSERLVALKENLDRLRLPENTSTQFFEELTQEDTCICGRDMTVGARAEIRARSKRYLDAEESGTINALKSDIDKFTAKGGEEPDHQRLTGHLSKLGIARRAEREANQLVRTIKQKLIEEGDEQLQTWQASLEEGTEQYRTYADILKRIHADGDPNEEPIWSLKQIRKKKTEVSEKIATITNTVTLRKKTDLLSSILERAADLASIQIKKELVAKANEQIRNILINDPLEIEQIEKSLRLADQDGASVGQTLSVGYTFLMSVLNRGNNNFPLVVDSPANPIDDDVRKNVGTLIPELCTQFVGFTINTERPGFVPALEKSADTIKYLTMFRKTEGTKRLMNDLPGKGVTETETAVLIEGREYFMSFGLNLEEEA